MSFGADRQTDVGIDGDAFTVNGTPTYEGRTYDGHDVEGLLFNSRMVQALFDDANPETRDNWAYPDAGEYDAERNVSEFVDAVPTYREYGLRAVTVNLQCGSPEGYSDEQPWTVSAYRPDGTLKDDWLDRLERVLETADEHGLVVILGLFYFGQDEVLDDEAALVSGVENAMGWLRDREYTNVLVEVCNETHEGAYDHELLRPDRVAEAVEVVREAGDGRYPVGVSLPGGRVPSDDVVAASDLVLVHGNGVDDPARIAGMVEEVRSLPSWEPMPVVFNEDDHFGFDSEPNNMYAALSRGASWGFFDPGENDYRHGYQSPPVEWSLNTQRKRNFFEYVARVTGTDVADGASAGDH